MKTNPFLLKKKSLCMRKRKQSENPLGKRKMMEEKIKEVHLFGYKVSDSFLGIQDLFRKKGLL